MFLNIYRVFSSSAILQCRQLGFWTSCISVAAAAKKSLNVSFLCLRLNFCGALHSSVNNDSIQLYCIFKASWKECLAPLICPTYSFNISTLGYATTLVWQAGMCVVMWYYPDHLWSNCKVNILAYYPQLREGTSWKCTHMQVALGQDTV